MANCPKCKAKLSLVKENETGKPQRIRCINQKTEKSGNDFKEVGSCDFKVNFSSKLYNIDVSQMKDLIAGKSINIKDNNTMTLDLSKKFFTNIEFGNKYAEEEF